MKQKKFLKKVQRYIELSQEFEALEEDLFSVEPVVGSESIGITRNLTFGSSCNSAMYVSTVIEPKTRAEVIMENAESDLSRAREDAKRADRYDEYIGLRSELKEICSALLKID